MTSSSFQAGAEKKNFQYLAMGMSSVIKGMKDRFKRDFASVHFARGIELGELESRNLNQ